VVALIVARALPTRAPRHLLVDAGHRLGDIARFAFDGVAEDERRQPGIPGYLGRRLESHLRNGDEAGFDRRQAWVA
jgi:hypothetical protein